jgi:hypothetical protein
MIWVRNVSSGFDLTDKVEGLQWTNVDPGGDETASFTLMKSWTTNLDEIKRGDQIVIGNDLDVLWQGRIEEHDRGADAAQTVSVTCYGLGSRLKDGTFKEIYRDPDLSNWTTMPADRRIYLEFTLQKLINGENQVEWDVESGTPGITVSWDHLGGDTPSYNWLNEPWYDNAGIPIGRVYYDWYAGIAMALASTNWSHQLVAADDQTGATGDFGTNVEGTTQTGTFEVTDPANLYLYISGWYEPDMGGVPDDSPHSGRWRQLIVYGRHGIGRRGTEPNAGFYSSDIVTDVVGRVDGLQARYIDEQTYIIPQMAFRDATIYEDAITEANRYEDCTWGTWGPESPLDYSTDGYFDYRSRDFSTRHWVVRRADCENLDLHSEVAGLYNQVEVNYTDAGGIRGTVTRTAEVDDLIEAGIPTRRATLDGGTITADAAAALGDTFLALTGGYAPARGSFTTALPVLHYQRGYVPCQYMRADGSNVQLQDILPTNTLFALDSTPDRRTTFPIKRVTIDAGGAYPVASVEVDQTNDLLSVLQSRFEVGTYRVS